MVAVNTQKAYTITVASWIDNMQQEIESSYDPAKLVDINFGKYAIMLRFAGYYNAYITPCDYWSAKIWSLSSLLSFPPIS